MNGVGRVLVELTFLPKSEGGRSQLPKPPWNRDGHCGYMPHLVVVGSDEFLGVRFLIGPEPVVGEVAVYELELLYSGVDYSPLVPGAAVTVREGKSVVARGRILLVK